MGGSCACPYCSNLVPHRLHVSLHAFAVYYHNTPAKSSTAIPSSVLLASRSRSLIYLCLALLSIIPASSIIVSGNLVTAVVITIHLVLTCLRYSLYSGES